MDVRRAGARLAMVGARRRLFGLAGVAVAAGTTALGASPVLATRAPSVGSPTTIMVEKTKSWGPVLALSSGWTVLPAYPRPDGQEHMLGPLRPVLAPGRPGPGPKQPSRAWRRPPWDHFPSWWCSPGHL